LKTAIVKSEQQNMSKANVEIRQAKHEQGHIPSFEEGWLRQ
jgi:hypothetical protein